MTERRPTGDPTVPCRRQRDLISIQQSILAIVAVFLFACPIALEAYSIVDKSECRFSVLKSTARHGGFSHPTKLPWMPGRLYQSTGKNDEDYVTPPRDEVNLVNQARYQNSIETLQRLVAKAKGETYQPSENPPVYVIGRFEVPLRIDTAPGLDLTETESEEEQSSSSTTNGGLVLVTSVTGNAADAGLQPLDTIVGVSCKYTDPPFQVNVNSQSLQTTAIALQTAVAHALSHNSTEIHLEMNRLIAGYYNPQQGASAS